jgi:hypothetical protein
MSRTSPGEASTSKRQAQQLELSFVNWVRIPLSPNDSKSRGYGP